MYIYNLYIKGTQGSSQPENVPFIYRLNMNKLFINERKLPFVDSDFLYRGSFKAGLTLYIFM
jgi:hypothetical protein